jgi:hypothetical protein
VTICISRPVRLAPAIVLAAFACHTPAQAAESQKPNVVYMMADDVGWGDLSVHGGGVPTPNIDRLFSSGTELSRFHGWCVCSPTRAMLLTGRHPFFSTMKGNNTTPYTVLLKPGAGVDQFGRDQSAGPGVADAKSVWEHRIVGLCNDTPGTLNKVGVVFAGGTAGPFTIYLDNVRVRHADGSATPVWTGSKDTLTGKFEATDSFKDLKIQTVKAADVGN